MKTDGNTNSSFEVMLLGQPNVMLWEGRKPKPKMAKVSCLDHERGFKTERSSCSELSSILLRNESTRGHLLDTILHVPDRFLYLDSTCFACPTIRSI
jgi:hypothetical protein